MLGSARDGEVRIERLVIEIEKIFDVERDDANVGGRFGFFSGREVNE